MLDWPEPWYDDDAEDDGGWDDDTELADKLKEENKRTMKRLDREERVPEVNMDVFLANFEGHPNGRGPYDSRGSDYIGDGDTPLMVASRWGYIETVRKLLRRGADPKSFTMWTHRENFDQHLVSPLSLSIAYGHTGIEEILREAGATE